MQFEDDSILAKLEELFERMIPYKKGWVGQASINITNDKELMKLARKSGCKGLLIGFESMTDRTECRPWNDCNQRGRPSFLWVPARMHGVSVPVQRPLTVPPTATRLPADKSM